MKIKISLSVLLLIFSIAFSSCKKHEQGKTTNQTIDVVLDMNKSYQYSFGSNNSDLLITEQSQSFLVSELDKVTDVTLFNYTPKANFVGSDEVQVTTYAEESEHHGGNGGQMHGNCQNHSGGNHHDKKKHDDDDDKTIYTFKIIVKQIATATPVVATQTQK